MNFPKSTELRKNVPKTSFYQKVDMNSTTKKKFQDYISSIYIINKLSKDTINIKSSKEVEEILVFQIVLKDIGYLKKIEDVLLIIDKSIPYPILFVLIVGKKEIMYKIAYKKRNHIYEGNSVVEVYLSLKEFNFQKSIYNSLNLKIFYEKIIRLFLGKSYKDLEIEEAVQRYKYLKQLKKELIVLEKKIIKEKQSDKKYKLYEKIKNIKKELK
jgi:hypothetical protein